MNLSNSCSIRAINAIDDALRLHSQTMINDFHTGRSLTIDEEAFKAATGLTELPPIEMVGFTMEYVNLNNETNDVLFITHYENEVALMKDAGEHEMAKQHGAYKRKGLSVGITVQGNFASMVHSAIRRGKNNEFKYSV